MVELDMKHLQKKVCMIGDFAVGKTSLVARFVSSTYSEKYLTTVGVKIDTKDMVLDSGDELKLVLWDIAGDEELTTAATTYLRGASAYILVIDGTRVSTLDVALHLKTEVDRRLGRVPFVTLVNKNDLLSEWEISEDRMGELTSRGWPVVITSAKTGHGVEVAFEKLAKDMMEE